LEKRPSWVGPGPGNGRSTWWAMLQSSWPVCRCRTSRCGEVPPARLPGCSQSCRDASKETARDHWRLQPTHWLDRRRVVRTSRWFLDLPCEDCEEVDRKSTRLNSSH